MNKEHATSGRTLKNCGCVIKGSLLTMCDSHMKGGGVFLNPLPATSGDWEKKTRWLVACIEGENDHELVKTALNEILDLFRKTLLEERTKLVGLVEHGIANWTTNYSGAEGVLADSLAKDLLNLLKESV